MMQDSDYHFIIKASAPYFAGHFPNNPVVPGAVILEKVLLKWSVFSACKVLGFDYCKFTHPLLAEVHCWVSFTPLKAGNSNNQPTKADFKITSKDNTLICKGRLVYGG
ncbi:MAG: hypothetical protein KAI02_00215 [Gammaproteobacteria bacterium]|nr:hypothetical protein [Bacteroidales bacterium]MCK5696551.1 hypothetical protein [Gammaproteobacteria bacterium]